MREARGARPPGGGSEPVLEGEEDAAGADAEAVLRARQGAVVDVFVTAAVKKVVGRQRQSYFIGGAPYRRCVKQYEAGCVAFGEPGQEVLRPGSELHGVGRNDGGEDILPSIAA